MPYGVLPQNDLSLLRSSSSEETLAVEEVLGSFDFLSHDFNTDDDTSCLGSLRLKDSGWVLRQKRIINKTLNTDWMWNNSSLLFIFIHEHQFFPAEHSEESWSPLSQQPISFWGRAGHHPSNFWELGSWPDSWDSPGYMLYPATGTVWFCSQSQAMSTWSKFFGKVFTFSYRNKL